MYVDCWAQTVVVDSLLLFLIIYSEFKKIIMSCFYGGKVLFICRRSLMVGVGMKLKLKRKWWLLTFWSVTLLTKKSNSGRSVNIVHVSVILFPCKTGHELIAANVCSVRHGPRLASLANIWRALGSPPGLLFQLCTFITASVPPLIYIFHLIRLFLCAASRTSRFNTQAALQWLLPDVFSPSRGNLSGAFTLHCCK